MEKIWVFLKKHWRTLLIVLLCVAGIAITIFSVAGVPLIINWAFTEPAEYDCFAVNWEAKDALSYYGDALGFIGTVIFSGLALWQNHVIQKANDEHTALLERMERIKNAPHLVVRSIRSNGKASKLTIHIKNPSENIAETIYASGFTIVDETGKSKWRNDEVFSLDYLDADRTFEIHWDNPYIDDYSHQFIFDLKYKDKFGGDHICKAVGFFEKGKSLPRFKLTEL